MKQDFIAAFFMTIVAIFLFWPTEPEVRCIGIFVGIYAYCLWKKAFHNSKYISNDGIDNSRKHQGSYQGIDPASTSDNRVHWD